MIELRVGDQLVRFDRDLTIAAYSHVERGDADRCGCLPCRNFALLRGTAYPPDFREFLAALGIDPNKEGEAFHYGPKEGQHLYGGWFYFVGELAEKGEQLVELEGGFQYFVSTAFPKPPAPFGKNVAAVEFTTLLPWRIDQKSDPHEDAMHEVEDIMQRYQNALRSLARSGE